MAFARFNLKTELRKFQRETKTKVSPVLLLALIVDDYLRKKEA